MYNNYGSSPVLIFLQVQIQLTLLLSFIVLNANQSVHGITYLCVKLTITTVAMIEISFLSHLEAEILVFLLSRPP